MADEPRFSWPTILRGTAIIVGVTAAVGFIVPIVATLALGLVNTGRVSGNEIYRWGYWVIAWGMTFWLGSQMIKKVSDRIIDDMLAASVVIALLLLVLKFVVWIVFEPVDADGKSLFAITGIDVFGAIGMVLVGLIAARINRY